MAYRNDPDLEFFRDIRSKDFNALIDTLTKDKDGDPRWTEELTTSASYKAYHPDHAKYWELIAAEIQCFGANSMMTIFRGGKGVLYREILSDVADKAGIKDTSDNDSAREVEDKILGKLIGNAVDKMSESERAEFGKIIGYGKVKDFTPAALTTAAQLIFKAGGFKSFQLTLMIANAVSRALLGRGLALAGNAALMRTAAVLTGPIGWAITGAWTAIDIAGPAFRVTFPAVIQVALLRKMHQAERDGLINEINSIL